MDEWMYHNGALSYIMVSLFTIGVFGFGWLSCRLVEDTPFLRSFLHRHLSGQWRLGLFVGLCCTTAGFSYGVVQ